MKLIRCYVENFGGITNLSYEFSSKLNIVNEDNGWGKTTLAVFIKSMFYGMESTTKRNLDENERKKYMPWNGGRFGGNIEFEVNDRSYRIERYFGQRDREDYFALYDLSTNLLTDDFSDNLGEEIFKIDREAFERSIYIPQQQISVEANDSLSAKLTNILESDNDINKYEKAIARLDEASKIYRKKGDKGKISELESELRVVQRELNDCISREEPYEELRNLLQSKQQLKAEYENALNNIDFKIQNAGDYAELNAKKAHYDELVKDYEIKEKDLIPVEDFFANGIPEYDEVASYEEYARKLTGYRHAVMQNMVCDEDMEEYAKLQNLFSDGVPEDDALNKCEDAIDKITELDGDVKAYSLTEEENDEFIKLQKKYGDCDDFESKYNDCTNKYKRYVELGSDIEHENSNLISLEAWKDHNVLEDANSPIPKSNEILIGVTGIILIVIGVILIANMVDMGAIMLGMGVTIIAAFFLMYLRRRWVSPEEEKMIIKNEEDILTTRTKINKLESERKRIKIELSDFSDKYTDKHSMSGMMNALSDINSGYNVYKSLANKKKNNDKIIVQIFEQLKEQISIVDNTIGRFFDKLGYSSDNDNESFTRITGVLSEDGSNQLVTEDGVVSNKTNNGLVFTVANEDNRYNIWKLNKKISQEKKWREILRVIREKKMDYKMLNTKITTYEQNYSMMREIEPSLFAFVSKYFDSVGQQEYEDCLMRIKSKVLELSRLMRELQTAGERIEKFVKENDFENMDKLLDEKCSIEILQKERIEVITKINDLRDECDLIKTRCSEFIDVITKKPELESEIDRIKNELNEANAKFNIFNMTKKYLDRAKEQFSARYLSGLNEGFIKYVKMLAGELEDDEGTTKKCLSTATLDTALNVKIEAYGTKKNVEYLSTGSRDLLGICSRLALVDAMYESEKPFLILDDPFVNLDEEKILNSLIFLEQVSEEYQIIYFACHPSRII